MIPKCRPTVFGEQVFTILKVPDRVRDYVG